MWISGRCCRASASILSAGRTDSTTLPHRCSSGAKAAKLSLDFDPLGVRLLIEDDGQGFDPAQRPQPGIEHGHGLSNIEERARDLGATLRLESAPGRGTRLEAAFPYSR